MKDTTATDFTTKISVLIVDDHPSLRAGVRAILEQTPDIYVIGEAENGEQAKLLLHNLHPKILLLDLKIPNFSPSGFEKWARENYPETITLVLTAHDRDAYLASMIDAGATGYLDKNLRAEQLITAIRHAAHGEYLITAEQLIRAGRWQKEAGKKWEKLTEREREVLSLIEKGLSNRAIATQLGITIKTVAYHVSEIFNRLNVKSRQEAIVWYQKYFPKDLE